MVFSEKLQILRKTMGYSQEALAERLEVSRQAVAKWEAGLSHPDLMNLIQLSHLFHVTVDYLIKEQDCAVNIRRDSSTDTEELIRFRLEASANTYAGQSHEVDSTWPDSHDDRYT